MIDDFSGPTGTPAEPPKQTNDQTKKEDHAPAPVDGGMPLDMAIDQMETAKKPKKKRSFHIWPSHLSKKKQIILGAFLVILIGGIIGFIIYTQLFAKTPEPVVQQVTPAEPAKPITSPLTGVEVSEELSKRPVTGVMIENSPEARPQSGLNDAGVVYEAVAEGGITRFLALFQEGRPDRIGPIRSARPYYLDWVKPFDAAYAHVGGSPEAIQQIRTSRIRDLDQFYNPNFFQRVPERYAPHNMYSSMKQLDEAKKVRKIESSKFTGFARKEDKPSAKPTARAIGLAISSALYNVSYTYSPKTNTYNRVMGGQPHKDEKTGKQTSPKVVIALVMTKGIAADGQHTVYGTKGSGRMVVFQDGTRIDGTWKKANRDSQFSFVGKDGKEIKLNAGQTWITVVDAAAAVTSKP
jgi:hypothetical protein